MASSCSTPTGKPYDGHTLGSIIDATEKLTGCAIERAYVDKGYRGHDTANPRRVFISGQKRGVFGFDVFVREFNTERPHEALDMKCPAELYTASARVYAGLPELTYPFHDRDVIVTACGRLCLLRKRINVSTVLAGQKLGIKEVDEGDLPRAAVRTDQDTPPD